MQYIEYGDSWRTTTAGCSLPVDVAIYKRYEKYHDGKDVNGMLDLKELMETLRIKHFPDYWKGLFQDAMKDYAARGGFFLERDYLILLNERYHLFEIWFDSVLEAAEKIKENKALLQFTFLLYYAMKNNRKDFKEYIQHVILPQPLAHEDPMPYDFVVLFALLPTVSNTVQSYRSHNVPEDVIQATLKGYESCLTKVHEMCGRPGYNHRFLNWMQVFVDAIILRVGRLQFHMVQSFQKGNVMVLKNKKDELKILIADGKFYENGYIYGTAGQEKEEVVYPADLIETDGYVEGYGVGDDGLVKTNRQKLNKGEWEVIFRPGDPIINIHIPAGANLTVEACEDSYRRGIEILKNSYPDFHSKVIGCVSWLLDPRLSTILNPDSKIVQFQKKYTRFPVKDEGKAVFAFVFQKPFERYEDLPENTSLERSIKKLYLNGEYIYAYGGFFSV